MLSKILKKSDCAACKFCCSFRRQSLWETPIFDAETVEKLRKLYPHANFRNEGTESFTFDISDQYKSSRNEEEAPCPFLDAEKGCVLPPEQKPFDCTIWPFRAVRICGVSGGERAASANCGHEAASVSGGGQKAPVNCGQSVFESGNLAAYGQPPTPANAGQIAVALTPTCPAINKVPRRQITGLLESGLGEKILSYAEKHPDIIKDASEFLSDIVYKRTES